MSSPAPAWTKLQLFDFSPVKDPYFQSVDALYSDPSLIAVASTNSFLVLAVHGIYLKLVDPNTYTQHTCFEAFDNDYSISYIHSIPSSNLLVAVAEKPSVPAILKVFDLTKIASEPQQSLNQSVSSGSQDSAKFHYLTQVLVTNGKNAFPISCMLFSSDLSCVAFGYTNGNVILIRGDLLRDRGSKQRVVFQSLDPITGIHYNSLNDIFYVISTAKIWTVSTTGRNNGKPDQVLASLAAIDLNCSAIDPFTQELIVADELAIRRYNHATMTAVIPFPGQKSRIYRLPRKDYLLVISMVDEINPSNGRNKLVSTVSILDLRNSMVSFNLIIPNSRISHVLDIHGDAVCLSNDGVLYKMTEKPDPVQLDLLVERELFNVALEMAGQQQQPVSVVLRITRAYGDSLYAKSSFDQAVLMFIRCLELFTAASEAPQLTSSEEMEDFVLVIITKFKDVLNIANLARFLRRLYELGVADNDHITLLFCCYCKLKQTQDLDSFIDDIDVNAGQGKFQNLNFLLVINLFEECGYSAQIIKLLRKLNQPGLVVGIQLNDLKLPDEALKMAKSLPIDDLLLVLVSHSKSLLDSRPIETTQLLINVFTGKYQPVELVKGDLALTNTMLSHDHSDSNAIASDASFTLKSYASFMAYISSSASPPTGTDTTASGPTYMPPRPSIVFASFLNHRYEFVIFLEACLDAQQLLPNADTANLVETLVEQYLSLRKPCLADEAKVADAQEWEQKARELVRKYASVINHSQLQLLGHLYSFTWENSDTQVSPDVMFQRFTALQVSGDYKECINLCEASGEKYPELYKQTLKLVAADKEAFDLAGPDKVIATLEAIDRHQLLSPSQVLDILCLHQQGGEEFINVGVVSKYFLAHFKRQELELENNQKLVDHYERESSKALNELTELTTQPFIFRNKTCAECGATLSLPLVHFKCKHSYHQRCLESRPIVIRSNTNGNKYDYADSDVKHCPLCADQVDDAMRMQEALKGTREDFEAFQTRLDESTDRFKYMCDFIGKGVMMDENPVTIFDE